MLKEAARTQMLQVPNTAEAVVAEGGARTLQPLAKAGHRFMAEEEVVAQAVKVPQGKQAVDGELIQ